MNIENPPSEPGTQQGPQVPTPSHKRRSNPVALKAVFILVVFVLGLGSGYLMGRRSMSAVSSTASRAEKKVTAMIHQINPPEPVCTNI